jgi:outer membrane receptor protein involved in Fe transport
MKRYFWFTILLLHTFSFVSSQGREHLITGNIVDENNAAVPYGNAALYTVKDSSLVGGAVSDATGRFEVATAPGQYYLKITFLSYQEKTVPNIVVSNQIVDVGTIVLRSDSKVLKDVVVTGERSLMELQLDKRVFNVSKDLSNIGASASEVLDNLPSVNVDVEGNVNFRGSQNVRILIDGKPSGLTGISSADALRQLQGDMIESVEVITNPSSRYEAEGEVGIINIILKKNRRQGLNGSFSVTGGIPDNYRASFNLNFRKNKFNFFTNYGISYRAAPGRGSSFQRFERTDSNSVDTSFVYEQSRANVRSDLSNNLMAGTEYFINDQNTLTATFLYRNSQGVNNTRIDYRDLDMNGGLVRTLIREEEEDEIDLTTEVSLNYNKKFAQEGRTLTADFKWINSSENEKADYRQWNPVDSNIGTIQRSDNLERERNLLFQADYVHPFGNKNTFETGVRSTLRKLNNNFLVEELGETGNYVSLPQFDNALIYTENIYAAYVMASKEIKKLSLQAGLRGELSDVTTTLVRTNEVNPRLYFNVFPSAHISYKLQDNKTIQLSYSYRLSRPRPRNLLPFSNFSDPRVIFRGNPNLNPEYTHSLETGYLLNTDNGTLLTSIYYRYRIGVMQRITVVDSTGLSQIFPVNLGTENAYGLEFNWSHTFQDWWRLNTNLNLYRAITQGTYNDQSFFADTYAGTSRITSKITFLKKVDFQQSVNYRSPRITPQGRNLSIYSVDLGLASQVLKGNGNIVFSVSDLFNSRVRRSIVDYEGYYSRSEFQWRRRQFLVTFTYRFNQKQDRKRENREERDDSMDMDEGEF